MPDKPIKYTKNLKDLDYISVLIINDDNERIQNIKDSLRSMGIVDNHIARTYMEAFEVLKKKTIAIVMVELFIKHSSITGVDFITTLRKDINNFAHVHDIPVIAFAGGVTKEEVEKARDAGINEFVSYPFSVKHLKEVMKIILNTPRDFIICPSYVGPDRRRKKLPPKEGVERREEE